MGRVTSVAGPFEPEALVAAARRKQVLAPPAQAGKLFGHDAARVVASDEVPDAARQPQQLRVGRIGARGLEARDRDAIDQKGEWLGAEVEHPQPRVMPGVTEP